MEEIAGCLLLLAGPPLMIASLMVIYFRTPKDVRGAQIGTWGRRGDIHFGQLMKIFRAYGKKNGRDLWLVLFLLSGIWSFVLFAGLVFEVAGPADRTNATIWSVIVGSIWLVILAGVWRSASNAPPARRRSRKR